MRYSQGVIERLTHGKDSGRVKTTQHVVEVGDHQQPADQVYATQNGIEWSEHLPVLVVVTQMCIEVAWPRGTERPPEEPEEPPIGEYLGANNRMLLADLSEAAMTLPDYSPSRLPEYD